MKQVFIMVVLAGLLLTGCAEKAFLCNKEGGSQEQFKKDSYECKLQSRTSWGAGGSGLVGMAMIVSAEQNAKKQANAFYKECMEARGYIVEELDKDEYEKRQNAGTTGIGMGKDPLKEPIVTIVAPNSPAALAGVRVGDKCIEKNGVSIKTIGDVASSGPLKPGDTVTYRFQRNDEEFSVTLKAVTISALSR